jgi:hypothetical protein
MNIQFNLKSKSRQDTKNISIKKMGSANSCRTGRAYRMLYRWLCDSNESIRSKGEDKKNEKLRIIIAISILVASIYLLSQIPIFWGK